jgi:peroxiredoxin Q/BCP
VSADPPAKLAKWREKKEFPYPLLGDEGHAVLEAWGVWGPKSFLGRRFLGVTRATFLVGKDGRIARAWPKVSPPGHAKDVLEVVKGLADGRTKRS